MNPDLLFDVRLQERNVTRGRVSQADLDAHLKALPDAGPNAANLAESLAERGEVVAPPAPATKAPPARKPGK